MLQSATPAETALGESSIVRPAVGSDRLVAIAASAVILVSLAILLTYEYGRDQSIYAVVGRELLAGRVPYRDAFDFKPPGIFVIFAFSRALFSSLPWGIRALESIAMLAAVAGLVDITRRTLGSWKLGYVAGAFAVFVHVVRGPWHTAQPEGFGAAFTVWGLALALRAWDSPKRSGAELWAAAGILFGFSGLLKPQLVGVGALTALLAATAPVVSRSQVKRGQVLRRGLILLASTAAGILLPIAATVAWFAWKGGLRDLYEVLFVFTPKYTLLSWQTGTLWQKVWMGLSSWAIGYSPLVGFGALLLLLSRPKDKERRLTIVLFAAIAVHMAGIVLQAKFFPYHWGATHPLSALVAVLGAAKLLKFVEAKGRLARLAVPLLVLAVAASGAKRSELNFISLGLRHYVGLAPEQSEIDASFSPPDFHPESIRVASQLVEVATPAGSPIYVWGFEPAIYDTSDRPLASRYIYNVPQRAAWFATTARAALLEELKQSKPSALLVQHSDVFSNVTGNFLDSAATLAEFPEMETYLSANYRQMIRAGRFDFYLRSDLPVPEGLQKN